MALKIHRELNLESLFDQFATLPEDEKKKAKDLKKQDQTLDKKD
ncbi:SPJ_0845 family protein [Xylocopilactobacillus apicola]|uniref:Uncharacterized protein n=1 Tax=Xylocopilactobacillus apicola TaxID=2932184 RepID=A0AAU9CZ16_9LACO|nr:SPJ_0845 family protein [Xylocopilactobacillus apicola]BDR59249.1 hypothetical protein XA3_16900 [Xylocopilactobacillus apicola]